MKKPTWVSIVGILGIIFGCFGILGGGQETLMPKMMQMQKEMFTAMEKPVVTQAKPDYQSEPGLSQPDDQPKPVVIPKPTVVPNPAIFKAMEKMWDVPEWFGTWSIFSGISKALISAFYLFASISLLQLKPKAVGLFYWATGANIALSLFKAVVIAAYSFSFIGIAMLVGGVFSALIDVVLIIVVATSDKSVFNPDQNKLPSA